MALLWTGVTVLALSGIYLAPSSGRPDAAAAGFLALIGGLLILLGQAAMLRPTRLRDFGRVLSASAALGAVIGAAGLALLPLEHWLWSRVHRIGLLVSPLAWLAGAFGLDAAGDPLQGVVGVANGRTLIPFAVGAEHLALPAATAVLVAGAVVLAVARARWVVWLRLVAAVGLYTALRWLVLVYLYSGVQDPGEGHGRGPVAMFFEPDRVAVSFLPLAFVLAAILHRATPGERLTELRLLSRPPRQPSMALAAGCFCLAAGLLFVDPGRLKPGRILIDDYHSGYWEASVERLDTESYGSLSVYSLTSLKDFLALHYPAVEVLDEPLRRQRLEGVDVLILKTPTRPFAPREILEVEEFVRRGGGLWLVGDHTNLLGMGTYVNAVAERFGLRFRYDACNALSTNYFGEWHPPWLARHPVMQRVPWFRLLTSATLELGWGSEPVMVASDLLSDPIDYSKPSFFGDISPDPSDDFGSFPLAAASRLGRGRVLAFSDSTVLSSFALFKEGHIELAMAVIDYLNRTNRLGRWPNRVLLALGAALALWGLGGLLRGAPQPIATTLIAALAFGGLGGAWLIDRVNRQLYRPVAPHTAYDSVAFLHPGRGYHLAPAISRILVPAGNEYSTFFVTMQRLGLVPREAHDLDRIDDDAAVVVVNPQPGGLEDEDASRLRRYVEGGGRLLVMLPDRPPSRTAGRLLSELGLEFRAAAPGPQQAPADPVFADGLLAEAGGPAASRLAGAVRMPLAEETIEVYSAARGSGRVAVVFGVEYFSRTGMGHVMEDPEEGEHDQLKRYRIEYFLVYDVLGLGKVVP